MLADILVFWMRIIRASCCFFLLILPAAREASAYSVLTHEAIIDSAWDTDLKPRLRARFPNATEDDLRKAHAFTYGGCIIQDMGYYPFGSKLFSDLVHYVRSGDFVAALFDQAQTLEEYAFAYGALAHYSADINGHKLAVNRAVPVEYPKLEARFGDTVTYADNPGAHIKTEFGFDVLQVARGRYAPQSYHDFIGFEVDRDLLDKAFFAVYALHLKDIFSDQDLAFGSYRHAVSHTIPTATRVAWKLKEKDIEAAQPGITRRKFLYNISHASYEREWKREYRKPGFFTVVLAGVLRIVPKVGPLKALAFKAPTPETSRMFELSFERTLDFYRKLIVSASAGQLQIADLNLDTGGPVVAGQYALADRAYAQLARKLADRDPANVPDALRRNILAFYGNAPTSLAASEKPADWSKTQAAVDKLKAGQ
jgi:hypothetical protein